MYGNIFILAALLFCAPTQGLSLRASHVRSRALMMSQDTYQLILVRHGESSWNKENKFTGWHDCPLSEKGHAEAAAAGALMKEEGIEFDIAYTSFLNRAIRTLWHVMEQTDRMYVPIINAWELNERSVLEQSHGIPILRLFEVTDITANSQNSQALWSPPGPRQEGDS